MKRKSMGALWLIVGIFFVVPSLCGAAIEFEKYPGAGPPAGQGARMTYDSRRDRLVLFGYMNGFTDDYYDSYSQTWEWDGVQWERMQLDTVPAGRGWGVLAYDELNQVSVYYGGKESANFSGPAFDETWLWDGIAWTQASPAHSPGLFYGNMVYDAVRSSCVYFYSGETWTWDGSDWTQQSPTHSPSSIDAMAYDPVGEIVVAWDKTHVWEWNGVNWLSKNAVDHIARILLLFFHVL